ncbi:MAG: Gfo/Idh/MocA family oxidoreductase [Afipia sp.]|nr:Gfo/Idh/MocA family oxidoreductase [Afipia sp.]
MIGGGRWGRVHASNLSQLLTQRDHVVWVSRHNQDILPDTILKFSNSGPAFDLSTSIDDVLSKRPTAALVVTAPQTHVGVTEACLRAGTHVFAEKPLAFTAREARSLIDTAQDRNLLLGVGLHLLSATYLHHFKSQIAGRPIARIALRWFDPAHEVRNGESKHANDLTPLAHDLYPHIWSIVCVLTGCTEQTIGIALTQADASIAFASSAGDVKIDTRCGRHSAARERKIDLVFEDGGTANFDFTQEPGSGTMDNVPLSPDPQWGTTPRPAMAEVQEFLKQVSSPVRDPAWSHSAASCFDSVTGAEVLHAKLS